MNIDALVSIGSKVATTAVLSSIPLVLMGLGMEGLGSFVWDMGMVLFFSSIFIGFPSLIISVWSR